MATATPVRALGTMDDFKLRASSRLLGDVWEDLARARIASEEKDDQLRIANRRISSLIAELELAKSERTQLRLDMEEQRMVQAELREHARAESLEAAIQNEGTRNLLASQLESVREQHDDERRRSYDNEQMKVVFAEELAWREDELLRVTTALTGGQPLRLPDGRGSPLPRAHESLNRSTFNECLRRLEEQTWSYKRLSVELREQLLGRDAELRQTSNEAIRATQHLESVELHIRTLEDRLRDASTQRKAREAHLELLVQELQAEIDNRRNEARELKLKQKESATYIATLENSVKEMIHGSTASSPQRSRLSSAASPTRDDLAVAQEAAIDNLQWSRKTADALERCARLEVENRALRRQLEIARA